MTIHWRRALLLAETIGHRLRVYAISHGLKVPGGAAGGFAAERRTKPALDADVERAV